MGIWRRIGGTNGGDSLAGGVAASGVHVPVVEASPHIVSAVAADQAEVLATAPGAVVDFTSEPPFARLFDDFGLEESRFLGQHMPAVGRHGWPVRIANYDEPHHFSLIGLFAQSFDHHLGF